MIIERPSAAQRARSPFAWLGSDAGYDRRWIICWMLFLVTSINYLDRQVFGLLIPDLQQKLNISELDYGRLVMAFQLSYSLMMVAAGRILDRIGARVGLALAVLVWSVAEIGHVLARTALGFGFARFFLGFGEAANFPACMKVIGDLFPAEERATATGIMNSAVAAGSIVAPVVVPLLAIRYGWQSAFAATGAIGFLWLIAWFAVHRSKADAPIGAPGNAPVAAATEAGAPVTPKAVISWRALLGYRQLWALTLPRILVDPIWYFYLFWLPKFLAQEHGIRGTAATPYLSAIFLCAGVGCIASGYTSSALIRRGWSVNRARKTVMWALVAIMSPILVVADRAGNITVTMALIGVAVGAHQALSTHLYTLASDLFPSRVTGVVVGLGSSLSGLASVGTAEMIGRVLENHPNSYMPFFVTAAALYPVAMVIIQVLSPRLKPAVLEGA